MSITCKGTDSGKFTVNNPSLGSAVESWTALMQTLANAQPEWWTNIDIDGTHTGTGDADSVATAATALDGENESENEDGPTVDLQAAVDLQVMEQHVPASSPGTTQDETVYGTADSRPPSDDDDDNDTDDDL
jgi:hypothetical protein